MARRRYLIAYDIANSGRLRRVIKVMEAHGQRLQYSVFMCDLSAIELVRWRAELMPILKLDEDSVVTIDLGPRDRPSPMAVYGVPRALPKSGVTVV